MNAVEQKVAVPANISPYVEALGVDGAIAFFRELGGSQLYLPTVSSDNSLAAQLIGRDKVEKLAGIMGARYIKVPIAKQWIAQVMFAKGASLNEIARVVRSDVATVRRWRLPDTIQLDLPLPVSSRRRG